MKFLAFCFLVSTCWLLYERVGFSKELAEANGKVQKMEELQKRVEYAQAEIDRLRGRPSGSKDDAWFRDALKPKLK